MSTKFVIPVAGRLDNAVYLYLCHKVTRNILRFKSSTSEDMSYPTEGRIYEGEGDLLWLSGVDCGGYDVEDLPISIEAEEALLNLLLERKKVRSS